MQSQILLRELYLKILQNEDDNFARKFIFKKCVEHQRPVLTYFQRILDGKDHSNEKNGVSNIKAILLKPVNDACNLACDYCYQGVGNERSSGARMSYEKLEDIIREILSRPRRDIQFLWHGGEPLLAGIDFYKKALELQAKHNVHNCSIWNGFQTNGSLLDQQWMKFINDNGFGLSMSFDGLEFIHDKHRKTHEGKGTYKELVKTFKLLQDFEIPFNVITVINDELVPFVDEYWNLIKQLDIKNLDIHPSCNIGLKGNKFLPPIDYSNFVNKIVHLWFDEQRLDIKISVVEEFFRVLTGNPIKTCYHAGVCSDIIAIEGNGKATPCTRPFNKADYNFGNVHESTIEEIIESNKFINFKRSDLASQDKASNCKWFGICHNGCPQHRLENEKQNINSGSVYCKCTSGYEGGNYVIWEHLYNKINENYIAN